MANSVFKNINYQIGKLCRLGSRKAKLVAISNRRKQQLRHLGERVYIFKALQQDEDIWEKDEISQLLLTIADLDQEQEMVIDEINEIKAENPSEELCCTDQDETVSPATDPPSETVPETNEVKVETPKIKKEAEKAEKKVVGQTKTEEKLKTKPKTPRRRVTSKKTTPAPKNDTDKQ